MQGKQLTAILGAAALLTAGCGSAESPPQQATATGAASTTSVAAAAPAPLPTTNTQPEPSGVGNCAQPPDGVQQLIDGSFNGGERLQDVFAVNGPGNLIYVGGNIIGSDGTKESSADVWLVKDEGIYVVYALSRDARQRTTWPDGRDLASAGDQYGSAVQDCVTNAERVSNAALPTAAYLNQIRQSNKLFVNMTDEQLLELGAVACESIASNGTVDAAAARSAADQAVAAAATGRLGLPSIDRASVMNIVQDASAYLCGTPAQR